MNLRSLVISDGGFRSAVLIELAIREDKHHPALLEFTNGISYQQHTANYVLKEHYQLTQSLTRRYNPIAENEQLLNVCEQLLRAIPLARKLQCDVILLPWTRHAWKEVIGLCTKEQIQKWCHWLKDFLHNMQFQYTQEGTYCGFVDVEIPMCYLSDRQIVALGDTYNVPWHLSHDCTEIIHCGQCENCIDRQTAFIELQLTDPVAYQKEIFYEDFSNRPQY